METTQYNKLHVITQERQRIEDAEKTLAVAKVQLEDSIEVFKILQNELNTGSEILVPLMREYLGAIQATRMAFAREMRDILRTAQEIQGLLKHREAMDQFCVSFQMMVNLVEKNANFKETITKIFNISEDKQ